MDQGKTKKQPSIIINSQEISWSFIQFIRVKKLAGDWDQTINAFWQARNHPEIIKYVQLGFKPDKNGRKYSLLPSKEMNEGKIQNLRDWWNNLYKPSAKPKTATMKDALKDFFREMTK